MAHETDEAHPKRPRNNDNKSPPSLSLPHELVVEILSRLPVKSLIRFRCVCKAWKTLISDTQFAKKHLQYTTKTMDPSTNHRLVWYSTDGSQEFSCKSCSISSMFNKPTTPATVLEKPEDFDLIIGSCNGLVCTVKPRFSFLIWNPTTKESKIIPAFNSNSSSKKGCSFSYGFGYDHISDDYKVVQMFHPCIDDLKNTFSSQIVVEVYALKANYWKNIGNFPYKGFVDESGMFVNGTLNWLVYRGIHSSVVVSIDLANYKFEEVLQPDYKDVESIKAIPLMRVLGGCLCIVHHSYQNPSEVWVMKEYRVKESWTKLFSIPSLEHPCPVYDSWIPLWISENGEILFMLWRQQLVLYNLKGNTSRECVVHDLVFGKLCTPVVYLESLVSPNVETEKFQHSEAASSHQ